MTDEHVDEHVDTEADDEPAEAEIVDEQPAQPPALPEHHAAIERAAELALTDAGVPGRDEFLALAAIARMLHLSGAAPRAIRESPYVAFHVAMIGRDLGISPSAAINLIDVIGSGNDVQVSLSPQLLNAQVRRLGLGRIVPGERTDERAVATAYDADGNVLGESEFTWADAITAGLVHRGCTPTEHVCANLDRSARCRQGWRTYPKRMLWWRAAGYCADDYFPEASVGLYSPEELGAAVDADGRALDPANVELPDGYDTPAADAGVEYATPDELSAIGNVVKALPDDVRANVTAWRHEQGIALLDAERRIVLTKPHLRRLWAFVRPLARQHGVDVDAAAAGTTADSPEQPPAAESAGEPAAAATAASSGEPAEVVISSEDVQAGDPEFDTCTKCGKPIEDVCTFDSDGNAFHATTCAPERSPGSVKRPSAPQPPADEQHDAAFDVEQPCSACGSIKSNRTVHDGAVVCRNVNACRARAALRDGEAAAGVDSPER